MKNLFLLTSVMFSAVISSCKNDNENSAAIKTLINTSYRDALASSSANNVVSVFTSDGVLMGKGAPSAIGSASLNEAYSGIFNNVALDLNFTIDEMIIGQQYGFVRSTSKGTAVIKANGQSVPEENRELFVVQNVDGDWKIACYLFNKMDTLVQGKSEKISKGNSLTTNESDENEVRELVTAKYREALNNSNVEAVVYVFANDAVVMGQNSPTSVGHEAIRATYTGVFQAIKLNLQFTIDEVVLDGEYGFIRSHSAGTITVNDSDNASNQNFREIFVVKKVDGIWKIVWYVYNQPASA